MPDVNDLRDTSSNPASETATWFSAIKPRQDASMRLICFPYAGAGATIFRPWLTSIGEQIDLRVANLPGRGFRLREKRFERMQPLVEPLAEALYPLMDRPFAFFGHSLGALIAFEVARAVRRRGFLPEHLFVSGNIAPQLPDPAPRIHQLAEDDFLREIRDLNGMPQGVLDCQELLEIVLPAVRSDFAVLETYVCAPQPPLDCAITVFGGLEDPRTTRAGLEGWRDQTSKAFELLMLPGDHFFIDSARPLLLQTITQRLPGMRSGPISPGASS
jgi:medium-chain acyl-[acyl-carrier-protein] hydrolase